MTRIDVTFTSGTDPVSAWFYKGDASDRESDTSRAVIVMAHGLAGVRTERLDAFAERFSEAGYACLVFDYRYWGDSEGRPRHLLSVARQRDDWRAAIAYARSLEGVDPERVVLWGTSFSGGHVLALGAEDHRVAAVISQCPFTSGIASSLKVPPLTSLRLTAAAVRDLFGSLRGQDPRMVASAGAPGDIALMTSPDALTGMRKLTPPGAPAVKEVSARFVLDLARDMPGRRARHITCPTFFAICERDTVAPAAPTQRYARSVPHSEIKLYDAGHFDIYVGEAFERNVADQLAFLREAVPPQLAHQEATTSTEGES